MTITPQAGKTGLLRTFHFTLVLFCAVVVCLGLAGSARAQTVLFLEGFEGSFPSAPWVVGDDNTNGTNATWNDVNIAFGGETTHSGGWKGYCAGSLYAQGATIANPTYTNSMAAYMERSIDLTAYVGAKLEFWFKIPSIEICCDAARVLVDGTNIWTTNQAVVAWTQVILDLGAFKGGVHTLRFEFDTDPSVNLEGWYLDDISVTAYPPPPNDNRTNAFSITGITGSTNGYNFGATHEAFEGPNFNGVWWRWTAPTNGCYFVSALGSSFNSVIDVFDEDFDFVDSDDGITAFPSEISAFTGQLFYIRVRGETSNDYGNIALSWGVDSTAPNNNAFASAIAIGGAFGSVSGNNCLATTEVNEPSGYATVWYRWTAPSNGCFEFNTSGSRFDTVLCLYTGTNLTGLSTVGCIDDAPGLSLSSRVTFVATSNVVYRVRIGGFVADSMGNYVLNWRVSPPPVNDHFTNATVLFGSFGPVGGNNCGATSDSGEPLNSGRTVWWKWVSPSNDCAFFSTSGSSFDTLLSVFTGPSLASLELLKANDDESPNVTSSRVEFQSQAGATYWIRVDGFSGDIGEIILTWGHDFTPPVNDNFTNATIISGATGASAGNNCNATNQAGESFFSGGRTIWWRWTPPVTGCYSFDTAGSTFDTYVTVYRGTNLAGLTRITYNDDFQDLGYQSRVYFDATNGVVYYIRVEGYTQDDVGDVVLNRSQALPPANDNFINATIVSGVFGYASAHNCGATTQVGEPIQPATKTVWWRWTAPADARYVFYLSNPTFDTGLCVYGGSAITNLNSIGCAQYPSANYYVSFCASAGEEYYIRAGSTGTGDGGLTLAWGSLAVDNDNFTNAFPISGIPGTTNGLNCGATQEAGEPLHFGEVAGLSPTIWYTWIAPGNDCVTFDTVGSDFDTTLGIYTGNNPSNLTEIAYNDDIFGLSSLVEFKSEAGKKYWIRITSWGFDSGSTVLSWYLNTLPPPNDNFASAIPLFGASGVFNGNNCNATIQAAEPFTNDLGKTVWFQWSSTNQQAIIFDTLGSRLPDTRLWVYRGSALSDLVPVAFNDDFIGVWSHVAFTAAANTNYWIRLDGFGQSTGDYRLSWGCVAQPLKIVQDGANVIISWSGNGYQLQGTPSVYTPPILWTTIPGQSPISLPMGNTNRFFRLICR
jgi:hypothetical protein